MQINRFINKILSAISGKTLNCKIYLVCRTSARAMESGLMIKTGLSVLLKFHRF